MTDLKAPQARAPGGILPLPSDVPYPAYRTFDAMNLLEIARLLYRERHVLVGIATALTAAALLFAFLSPRFYRAEVLLAPVSQNRSEGLSMLMGQLGDFGTRVEDYMGGMKDRSAESIATLRSRSLASDFIRAQNLKPQLFAEKWDAERKRWRDAEVPTDLEAYEVFDRQVRSVNVDRRTGLVSLSIEWKDPALAAAWANQLVREVNARRRNEAIYEAQQSILYLQQQLARTSSVEIQQSIYHLIEAQTKSIAVANSREDYAFRVIDPAVVPERPVRPRRLLIVVAGFAIGTFVAIVFVSLRQAWRRQWPLA
ncbi:MAG: GNVR domain-containing protein [Sulfurifustis sp.]